MITANSTLTIFVEKLSLTPRSLGESKFSRAYDVKRGKNQYVAEPINLFFVRQTQDRNHYLTLPIVLSLWNNLPDIIK